MERQRRSLPLLALLSGLTWMGAVLLISANLKDISPAGDLAYDSANRVHTLALAFLLVTVIVLLRTIRASGVSGGRAATVLFIGVLLMFVGNIVSFWGALVVDRQSDLFWGGLVGWVMYLPGSLLVVGAFIGLARVARQWPGVSRMQRWTIGSVGVLFAITSVTWAISPVATLVPAVLAAFALLTTATTIARITATDLPGLRATAVHG